MNENKWLKKADDDLTAAEILIKEKNSPTWVICFHCQQSAEKYLKAYLISQDVEFKELHDLMYLFGLCVEKDAEFIEIREYLKFLNPYSVATRYPFVNTKEYTIEEAKQAIGKARKIKELIIRKLDK